MIVRYLAPLLAFVAGVCLLQLQTALPPVWPAGLAALTGAVLGWRDPRRRTFWLTLVAICLGLGWAGMQAGARLAGQLPAALEGKVITVPGHIVGLPQASAHGWRFTFATDSPALPRRIQVSWYGKPPPLAPGQRWQLSLRLKRVHGAVNPGGPDLEAWMLQQDIGATATVRAGTRLPGHAPAAAIDRLRALLAERIRHALGPAPQAGVIVALTVGEQSGIALNGYIKVVN
ncbi:DUF4131 domain-containing protein [Chitiniphilus purpureus]|uniref:DUF4131 domain-containing protein n=1 Tax=Chitiniphilus purpureus TaxID=2981137 RepID=A0ABY6DQM5_9NEIS|nr:ComEC/Rec2 family competence protein [Chitiniphilus sp. CD1]UXY16655.1 DUF4131 domain-containing protein [Chitiniphilus sp. CD1]